MSEFVSQTFGMWALSRKHTPPSRNNLATSRSWLQVDENWRLLSVYVSGV
jgi:hypothetical protein